MSIRKSISVVTILVLIVGLAVGAGGGYLYSTSSLQPKITEYESRIVDLESQVDNLTSGISELSDTLTQIEGEKSILEVKVEEFETQVSALEALNNELEAQRLVLENEISDLEEEFTSLYSQNEDLEELLHDQEDYLSEVQGIIDDLEDEISDLESDKDYLKSILEYYLPENFTVGITVFESENFFEIQAVANITQAEINEYCEEEGYPYRFEFIVYRNFGDPYEAVETTIRFKKEGVNLIVGHETDNECELSLNYVNSHEMLMMSPSATSRSLSIADDAFYRTCPTDLGQAPVMAEMLDSWGIEAVIVILQDDTWGNGLYHAFEEEFEERGGIVHKVIRHDPAITTAVPTLNSAESSAQEAVTLYTKERTAVMLLSKSKAPKFVEPVEGYFPTLSDLMWFGSGSIVDTKLFANIASHADRLKLFGPLISQEENLKYLRFADEYSSITGESPDFYRSALYDACWLYGLSVVEALTVEASFVRQVLPSVASDYHGASGWCKFDEYGDRENVDYEIRGFTIVEGQLTTEIFGHYDSVEGSVTWFYEKGINPPG